MILTSNDAEKIVAIKIMLFLEFEMTHTRLLHYCLRLEVWPKLAKDYFPYVNIPFTI